MRTKLKCIDEPCIDNCNRYHSSLITITIHFSAESGVVLESRTAAAVVSQLNRHQCEDRTRGENTRRAGRDQVAE